MPTITIDNLTVEEAEALQLYESGWRFVEQDRLTPSEQAFVERLRLIVICL